MTFSDLKDLVYKLYGPALVLKSFFPREMRGIAQRNFLVATVFLLTLVGLTFALGQSPAGDFPGISFIAALSGRLYGIFLLVFVVAFLLSSLEAFHRSYYFRGLDNVLDESGDVDVATSWEVATIVDATNPNDVTKSFLDSEYGQEIFYRLGITEEVFNDFFAKRTSTVAAAAFVVEKNKGITLETYAESIFKHDEELRHFLAQHNVAKRELKLASRWVTHIERTERRANRWWSRDNLGRIPGIGKNWSYGETYLLERFGHDLTDDRVWSSALMGQQAEENEVDELERILARKRQANAVVVGEDIVGVRQRVAQLYHMIRQGTVLPALEGKRVFFLDLETLVTANAEKARIEEALIKLMNQAVEAGNVIIYIERYLASVNTAITLEVDLTEILLPYFDADTIQLIIGANADDFHAHLSRDSRITSAFDVVTMEAVSNEGLINLLQQRATVRERETGVVFSIPALESIATLAERYFPSGVMPDKAFDLLEELVPMALAEHIEQVQKNHVEELVHGKTGVPMGTPTHEEKEKLLSLEDFLHRRVVGQDQAVRSVARALRRARAGVGSAEKPMGTFLFLGPTGVGKTETAKALAESLFNDENMMIRLDMSEFSSREALDTLIGSQEKGTVGRLATLVKEKQYGVLLLDEFEKSHSSVHNLFLQILDEGYFTDGEGKRINARNLIIIATSNAGANVIWEWEKKKEDLTAKKRELVDYLIERGLFRPEFLNRFDDIVIFHSLKEDHVQKIARIQLNALKVRLEKDQNINLVVDDMLVKAVAKLGYDRQFGGRPMQRAIKEYVEQAVADRLLAETLQPGDTLTLTPEDLEQIK